MKAKSQLIELYSNPSTLVFLDGDSSLSITSNLSFAVSEIPTLLLEKSSKLVKELRF